MTKSFLSILAVLMVGCFVASQVVSADDVFPPPWRGQEGTTQAVWEFGTSDPSPSPDFEFNPYGPSNMNVYAGVGQEWWDIWGGRQGVWPLSGTIEVEIPNRQEPRPYKDIWVQVTWAPQAPDTYPLVSETLSGQAGGLINEIQLEPTLEPPPADDFWYHSTYLIHIEPNPAWEIVRIDGAIMVDQIVIDTICIPEPATMLLLSIGGLAVLRKKRT